MCIIQTSLLSGQGRFMSPASSETGFAYLSACRVNTNDCQWSSAGPIQAVFPQSFPASILMIFFQCVL